MKLEGVIRAHNGKLQGEAVEVLYDAAVVSFADLIKKAKEGRCAWRVIVSTDEEEKIANEVGMMKVVRTSKKFRPGSAGAQHENGWRMKVLPYTYAQRALTFIGMTKKRGFRSPTQEFFLTKLKEITAETNKTTKWFTKEGLLLNQVDRSQEGLAQYVVELKEKLESMTEQ